MVTELISRAAKHLFTTFVQNVEPTCLAAGISHFYNCLLSSCHSLPTPSVDELQLRPSKKKNKRKGRPNILTAQDSNDWLTLTNKSLWLSLHEELDSYYGWKLHASDIDTVSEKYGLQKSESKLAAYLAKVENEWKLTVMYSSFQLPSFALLQ